MKHARSDYDPIQDPRPNGIPVDEPVFILRGQDRFAADTVDMYADFVEDNGGDMEIVQSSREQARRMRDWPKHKMPDLPRRGDGGMSGI